MLIAAAAVFALAKADPQALLLSLQKKYSGLKSFSMSIVQSESSGQFPGDFTQELRWAGKDKFDLKVKKPNPFEPKNGGLKAPDYYADGTGALAIWPTGARSDAVLHPDEKTTPGWEVTGGFIMSWLQNTATAKILSNPPQDLKARYEFGRTTKWQYEDVQEIIATYSSDGEDMKIHFYVSADSSRYVGFSWIANRKVGFAHYLLQAFNPKLPDDVGKPPK